MIGTVILDLILEEWMEWITTDGTTAVMAADTAEIMIGDMITVAVMAAVMVNAIMDTVLDTEEDMAGVTVEDMITGEATMVGVMVDTCMGTVPDMGEAMDTAADPIEAMPDIIEDITAEDTDMAEALEWAEDIGVPIIGGLDMIATAIGIKNKQN
jgi:hypothetical protein